MIIIVIEHCYGEIIGLPKIIKLNDLDKYRYGPYLIYLIDIVSELVYELVEEKKWKTKKIEIGLLSIMKNTE